MAKSKSRTTKKIPEMAQDSIKKTSHKDTNVVRGWLQVLEEHVLCQEAQQERSEEGAEAIKDPVKPKLPQGLTTN